MNEEPILRPAAIGEIEALRAIDKAARLRYLPLSDFAFAAQAPPIAAQRFSVGSTIVAELDRRPAGFALAQPLDGLLYLANISVLPEAAGRGIGAELLHATVAIAHQLGLPAVTLATFKSPPWNGPWFRKHGFVPMPDEKIGAGLRAVLDRHATFLDMTTRETLWNKVA